MTFDPKSQRRGSNETVFVLTITDHDLARTKNIPYRIRRFLTESEAITVAEQLAEKGVPCELFKEFRSRIFLRSFP